jgi:succinate dehydrogenase/fumarate reductase cytochrome b subunit
MFIFILAFVMFYFMGVRQLVLNVMQGLQNSNRDQLTEYFSRKEDIPQDLTPYLSKLNRFYYVVNQAKRKSIPWCILILILGILSFLLGAAHHTNVVDKSVHVGVVFGPIVASTLGCIWMVKYLGDAHRTLKSMKELFGLKSHHM